MNIIITGRHMELTDNLKGYVEKKLKRFKRYLGNITEVVVTLSTEKYRHKTEVILNVNGMFIQAESITGEIYSSIDDVMEKLGRQVKKYKEKIVSHRSPIKKEALSPKLKESIPTIIKRNAFDTKPMSLEEAAIQMKLLERNFFVFTNTSSGDINVLYKRKDGNFGLIEPRK